MRIQATLAVAAAFAAGAVAQDKITLTNGDVLTGTIKSMADGKVVIASPALGDVTVPIEKVGDMTTGAQVKLETKTGDLLQRRLLGIEGGNLKMEGASTSLPLADLGQINPPDKKEPEWVGSVKVNGLYATGNTERKAGGLAVDASRRSDLDRISFDASWDYGQDKQFDATTGNREWTLTQRRTGGGLKYDYFLTKRWYALATARVLGDTLAQLQLRFTSGAGLGYTWIEDSSTTFVTEAGLSYLNENYRTADPSVDYVAVRAAYKLTHELSKTSRVVHGIEAFPSTENSDDIYLQSKTELVTSLTESMLASISHVFDYDNTPATGQERGDHRVLLSIGWSF
jgi:putative salt-induced outer membrane protein YdiY